MAKSVVNASQFAASPRFLEYGAPIMFARWILLAFFAAAAPALSAQGPTALKLTGDVAGTHDPAIAREGNRYYVFATGSAPGGGQFAVRCSEDLADWKRCGSVFERMPDWIRQMSPKTRDLWAPDVSFFNGKYHLYYAFSSFGSNVSGIALATNETLDRNNPKYRWNDEGLVLASTASDDFNAIDPNVVLDGQGVPWLSLGSFWTGIKMRRLDAATGKLSAADPRTYSLAARVEPQHAEPPPPGLPANWQAIEAPFIVHHGRYYYLFVSFDLCCRGIHSTYRTMVGRSKHVTGPYVDADGKPMLQGGGTPLLVANRRWLGPGGESVLKRAEGDIIVFHAYDAVTGRPSMQISTLIWKRGWPHAALSEQ
jgi:arabinan endo-1,5-alpha-L-arabinosidase